MIYAILALLIASAHAMPVPRPTLDVRKGVYAGEGLFIGGEQSGEVSLIGFHRLVSANKSVERLVLSLGDASGVQLKEKFPFYQVSLTKDKLVIDISQLQRTRLELRDIARQIRSSQLVKSADFTMDPEDSSSNLTLHLKKTIAIEVYRQAKKGELIIDLKAGLK